MISISEETRSRLYRDIHLEYPFVIIKDLGNRTIALRKGAVADIFLSSEAYDDFGPEHYDPGYEEGTPVQLPDPRDWEIIDCLAYDGMSIENFAEYDVDRVRRAVMITDQRYETLVADGHIKPEDLEAERAKNQAVTNEIFELATSVVYQLSSGIRRSVKIIECNVYEQLGELINNPNEFGAESFIVFQSEGYHRSAFINSDAVDYISIPTHLLEKGKDDASAETLDEMDDEEED